eukprot:1147529-Pelagomonas_calceolata.AAC.2
MRHHPEGGTLAAPLPHQLAHIFTLSYPRYADDEYVLEDGAKTARVHPTRGVKKGCPLSPLLSSLFINDLNSIAEDVRGAVTGTEDVCVTHMLYADDLKLLSNEAGALQTMLCKLNVYARKKHMHLIINTVISEVVHFNSKGSNLPVFTIGSDTLAHRDSFKYLGMMFYRTLNLAKSALPILGQKMHLTLCLHLLTEFVILYLSTLWQIPVRCMLPCGLQRRMLFQLFLGYEANYH